jgi:hypothetical protein
VDTTDHPAEPASRDRSRWWWLFLVFAALPLVIWWMAWFPGMLSTDSLRQLTDIDSADFNNEIPAIHSIVVWLITRLWDSPAAVTLVQVAAMVALLAAYIRRSPGIGVPWWLGGVTILVFGWLPAVGATTIALELQVAQTLIAIWVLVELMALVPDPTRYLRDPWATARLSTALGMAWLFDHAGVVVVAVVFGALAVGFRRSARLLAVPVAGAVALFVLVQGPLYAAFSVDRGLTPLGEAYAPEIAAVYRHDPAWFNEADLDLLSAVADPGVWEAVYTCGDGAALIGDRDFDTSVIRSDPGAYRGLLFRSAASHPRTFAGHRWCAARVLLSPVQPHGERFSTYVYNVPPNDLGVARDSLWGPGFNATKAILVRIDQPARLWLFWRSGTLVWPALAGIAALAIRRRQMAWPGLALVGFLFLAMLTVREPSFKESFAVYSLAFLSLPLWALVWRREKSAEVEG